MPRIVTFYSPITAFMSDVAHEVLSSEMLDKYESMFEENITGL